MAASYKGSLLPEALLNYLRGALSRNYSLLDLLSRLSSTNEHSPFKHRRVCIPSCALAGGCATTPSGQEADWELHWAASSLGL